MLHGDKIFIEAEKLIEKQRGGKSMATSSIFRNIVLTEEKDVENFVSALEEAKAKGSCIPNNLNRDMTDEEIIKYLGGEK